jgi:cysteine-rich repeat protein
MGYRVFACCVLASVVGCATPIETDGDGDGGSGGSGTTTASVSSTAMSTAMSSSTGMGCAQNCADVEAPACTQSVCNMQTGMCELEQLEDGAPCEDGLFCTIEDTCSDGVCKAGMEFPCKGSTEECVLLVCDETEQECVGGTVQNGSPCTSDDPCSSNAICQNGLCLGAPKDCSATPLPNECNTAVCDPLQNGDCVIVPTIDGLPCVVGDPCESDKACLAGTCVGTLIPSCTLCQETEPNDNLADAENDPTCTGWQGQIGFAGDWDTFVVDIGVPGSRIRAEITDVTGVGCPAGFDSVIRVFDSNGVEIAQNDSSPFNYPCSLIDVNAPGATNLAVGTYYVRAQHLSGSTSLPYLLLLNTFAPGCGDGILQTGEQCDDNNTADGDGCSSTCTLFDCAPGETLIDVSATGLPVAILDNSTSMSTLSIAQTGTLTRFAVIVNITHTYDGDLTLTIDPPAASPVVMSELNGGSGENYTATVFSSDSSTPITTGAAPFTGVFAPAPGSFAATVGTSPAGTWTFTVQDSAFADEGAINAWKIVGCVQP